MKFLSAAKKFVAALVALMLVLPLAAVFGGLVFLRPNPFEALDAARRDALLTSVGTETSEAASAAAFSSVSDRFIVQFKKSVSADVIYSALSSCSHSLISSSEDRLFVICPDGGESFFEANSEIIDYYEPDGILEALAVTDDPILPPAYEQTGIYEAWDITAGSESVLVAVLDTGVFRNHTELSGARILSGYDAVARKSGVTDDTSGHGTAVIGIIAATANNKEGFAGVAHGASILPVKVASSRTVIYSSDLISGIRFAADAGADVINMSVGGYSSSYAEQDAVNYAREKGCVLIAASGNEGMHGNAGSKCYPASYDGVISVASCDSSGNASTFSQYNECVDVAAPGEGVTVLTSENGVSGYGTDSGTSYSCAMVSGIAALAFSHIDSGVRFESDEFMSLVISVCGAGRDDRLGYGVINAEKLLGIVNNPIITGVSSGGIYPDKVTIGFNRGIALLNGREIEDGEAVIKSGLYILSVSEGEAVATVSFRVDYAPLSYKYNEYSAFSSFTFEKGTATLNGFPYASGTRITVPGSYSFELVCEDEILRKSFELRNTLPEVYGVSNGEIYRSPVYIRIVGDGTATLSPGGRIYGETAVFENGTYTLSLRSGSGKAVGTVGFTVDCENSASFPGSVENTLGAADSENGYVVQYGESLAGARICSIDAPDEMLYFLEIGRVYGHAFAGEKLYLFGEHRVASLNRKRIPDGADCVETVTEINGASHFIYANGELFCFDDNSMYSVDSESGGVTQRLYLGFACEYAFYEDGLFYMLSPSYDDLLRIADMQAQTVSAVRLNTSADGAPLCFGNGMIAVGNTLFDASNGEMLMKFQSERALKIDGDCLLTENYVIDIPSCEIKGMFADELSCIDITESEVWLFGAGGIINRFTAFDATDALYGAAARTSEMIGGNISREPFKSSVSFGIGSLVSSSSEQAGVAYYTVEHSNAVYSFNVADFSENRAIPLKFEPAFVNCTGGFICVGFKDAPLVYVASADSPKGGEYIALPLPCENAVYDGARLYAAAGGFLCTRFAGTGEAVMTDIEASDLALTANGIVVTTENRIAIYSLDLQLVSENGFGGGRVFVGNYIAAGSEIYSGADLISITSLGSGALACVGNVAVTENGIFDIDRLQYDGELGDGSLPFCFISGERLVYFCVSRICSEGFDSPIPMLSQAGITGVSEGALLTGSAKLGFSAGIGFLDGKAINSGHSVTTSGEHIFRVLLPFGRCETVSFAIIQKLESIEIIGGDTSMNIGEKITLFIRYLPEGASSVYAEFEIIEGGNVAEVDENGCVTALSEGNAVVRASVSSESLGIISDTVTVAVRNDLIRFGQNSGITIERSAGFIVGVPAGMSEAALVALLSPSRSAMVFDKSGNEHSGIVGTGCRLAIYDENGVQTDALTIVVGGDTDGDGLILTSDLYHIERILKGYSYEDYYIRAADVNESGNLDNSDFYTLKRILTGRIPAATGTPDSNLFGAAEIQTQTITPSGGEIDVAICLTGCKYAYGMSGIMAYSSGLELIECESADNSVGFCDSGESVQFYSYDENAAPVGRAFAVVCRMRFRVKAAAGTVISFSIDGLDVCFASGEHGRVKGAAVDRTVSETPVGDFSISVANAKDFDFSRDIAEYKLLIPYNAALADISFVCPAGGTVSYGSAVIDRGDDGTVFVRFADANGGNEYYTLRITRQSAPEYDSNCLLASLEIEGFPLVPVFDPHTYEYTVEVPFETKELHIYSRPQNKTATVITSSTLLPDTHNKITVTVVTPDGEKLVYTLKVTRLEENRQVEEPPVDNGDKKPSVIWIIVAVGAVLSVACAVLIIARKRKKSN